MEANDFIFIKDKAYALNIIAFLNKFEYEDNKETRNPSLEAGYSVTTEKYYNIQIVFKGGLSPDAVSYMNESERDLEFKRVNEELYYGRQ